MRISSVFFSLERIGRCLKILRKKNRMWIFYVNISSDYTMFKNSIIFYIHSDFFHFEISKRILFGWSYPVLIQNRESRTITFVGPWGGGWWFWGRLHSHAWGLLGLYIASGRPGQPASPVSIDFVAISQWKPLYKIFHAYTLYYFHFFYVQFLWKVNGLAVIVEFTTEQ